MNESENVVELPDRIARLAKRFNAAKARCEGSAEDWIIGTLDAAAALDEGKGFCPATQKFGDWLVINGFAIISKDHRAGLLRIADAAKKDSEVTTTKLRAAHTTDWDMAGRMFPPRLRGKTNSPGPKPSPHLARAEELVRQGVEAGKPFEAALGLSPTQARNVRREAERRVDLKARVKAEIAAEPPDLSALPEKSRIRIGETLEAYKRKMEKEFKARVYHEAMRQAKENVGETLDYFRKKMDEVDRFIDGAREGVFTKAEFAALTKCMHPDNVASKETREECLRLLLSKKAVLVKPERDNDAPPLPATWEELMAMRRKK